MTTVDLIKAFDAIWSSTKPEKRIHALRQVRSVLSGDLIDAFDALLDSRLHGIEDVPDAITLVLVHGIQTDGAWQFLVRQRLGSIPNLNVVPLGYGFFSALGLFGPFRGGPIEKIARELRDIRANEPNARLMVIAHSYGSYVISKILERCADIKFERVVLCGCIVSRRFRWDIHAKNLRNSSIVNDVGTRDPYPVVATTATIGYGSSGRMGFQTARVVDRYFDYGHSDFFTKEHIDKYWRPFIQYGTIVDSEWSERRPKSGLVVNVLSSENFSFCLFYSIILFVIFGVLALSR